MRQQYPSSWTTEWPDNKGVHYLPRFLLQLFNDCYRCPSLCCHSENPVWAIRQRNNEVPAACCFVLPMFRKETVKVWSGVRKEPQNCLPLPGSMLTVRLQTDFITFFLSHAAPRRYKSPRGKHWQNTKIQPDEHSLHGFPHSWLTRTLLHFSSSQLKAHYAVTIPHSPAPWLGQKRSISHTVSACWLQLRQQKYLRHRRFSNPVHNAPNVGILRIKQHLTACF